MSKELTAENMVSVLTDTITSDESLSALSSVTAKWLEKLHTDNRLLAIYYRIDELDETLLDILAYDFKIGWWNSNLTLDEKRGTLKNIFKVHRTRGTPASVIAALSPIFSNVEISEWWQYGGEPYHYKLTIDTGSNAPDYEKVETMLNKLPYFSNLRSILDGVELSGTKNTTLYIGTASVYDRQMQYIGAREMTSGEAVTAQELHAGAVRVYDAQTQYIAAAKISSVETISASTAYAGASTIYDRQTTAVSSADE